MSIRNFQHLFRPRSVAVIGASSREGSVGAVVLHNIVQGGFEGPVWPVNPKYREIGGLRCFDSIDALPDMPDLAVVLTPPATVPGLIAQLAHKGTRAAVVITAGLTVNNGLRQAMLDASRSHALRIVGPNTLGMLLPAHRLNASFAHLNPAQGGLALLSQSGAIVTSLIDWAGARGIGFSHVVSLGDMADVDTGDGLDWLASDASAKAVLMYLETITHPRKFMSAARSASRVKPVVAIKSGRHAQAAQAAATHTGALSGGDRVADAALRRAGVLRVRDLDELFGAAATLARYKPLARARVAIVTNGGGAGVLAVDRLLDCGAELATLSAVTVATLDRSMPPTWSRANPVDIIGDAPPQRYVDALHAVVADEGVDVVLVLNCPTAMASSADAARAVAALVREGYIDRKPVVAAWLGDATAAPARSLLEAAGVACYATPSQAAQSVAWLDDWSRAQRALMRVPSHTTADVNGRRGDATAVFDAAAAEGRRMLTEPEAKHVLAAYGIEVPRTIVAATPEAVVAAARDLFEENHDKVVVKLLSREISHKSDLGGVVLDLASPEAAGDAARTIARRVATSRPDVRVDGYAVQPMVTRRSAYELIIGMSRDPLFGPAILFGQGGTAVELLDDTAIGLPPLDDVLGGDLIDATRIGRLLAGYRDRKPVDRAAVLAAITAVSALIVDFPCIVALDVNPLLTDEHGAVALDARIEIDPARVREPGPNRDLAIRPWPADWQREHASPTGECFQLRPVKPSDVNLYEAFFLRTTEHDVRLRFLSPRRHFSQSELLRLTQLDYAREMAFMAIDPRDGSLAGVGRLACSPDGNHSEYALIVRSDLQRRGLGRALMAMLIDFARAEGVGSIEGHILAENDPMIDMVRRFGFTVGLHPEEPGLMLARLTLRPPGPEPG